VSLREHPTSRAAVPVPAVVVGGTLNALGVVRSLARGQMPIYLLETTRQCAAGWSRHCSHVPVATLDGRVLIDKLCDLARRLECRPVLILTSDESVNCISASRSEIQAHYRISLPPQEMVSSLADKTLFQAFAESEGFAVPRSACVSDPASLERIHSLNPPLIIKPADKTFVLRGLAERAVRSESVAQAYEAARKMLDQVPQIIVQEWIDGPDTELFFTLFSCDRSGRLIGSFTGRKLLCSPPEIGSTALCVAAPEVAEQLLVTTKQFIERVGYCGLGSLEFKRDQRDGRFLIIEPTVGRSDWQEEIATLCGVNLPLRTYRSELEADIGTDDAVAVPAAWRESAEFRTSPAPRMHVADGFFRWSDPMPALYYYGYERGLLRVWRRAVRSLIELAPRVNKRN
jgi:D-aspartate ligase